MESTERTKRPYHRKAKVEPVTAIAEGGVVDGALMGGNERGPELLIPLGMTKADLDAVTGSLAAPVEAPAKRTKVAILGFVPHFAKAPFDDPSFEIWGLNELYQHIPRWDRWFELHKRELYENDRNRTSVHVDKLKAFPTNIPIYMQKTWPDIPASVEYPMAAILNTFPNPCPEARPYLTNSITYEILLAIAEGFQEIHLYGVDMAADCLAPEMRVLTADLRWVPASSLTVGQELLAFDEDLPEVDEGQPAQYRKYRRTRVESMSTIKRPCYRLRMADGSTLISSEGHQWLTLGGIQNSRRWLETKTLQPQNVYPRRTSKIVKLMETWDEDRSWEAGYLAAAFDGEGHVSQGPRTNCSSTHMSVGFSQKQNEMSECVEQAMAKLGFAFRPVGMGDDCYKYTIQGSRSELLRFLGSIRPPRLLSRFNADQVGTANQIANVPVLESESIGEQEVIGLTTGTQTLIVEGFASHNSEYSQQRPSCEWAVGIAQGRGIKVYIPSESDLLKTLFFYGYEEDQAAAFDSKLRAHKALLMKNLEAVEQAIGQQSEARAQYRGALQDVDHWLRNWKSNEVPTTSS